MKSMNYSYSFTQQKKAKQDVKEFESREWRLADIEHYGQANPFERHEYKFVARNEDNQVVGILDLKIEANVAYLENILVGHEFRKQGIGEELVAKAEKFAQDEGCTKIWLDTDEDWGAAKFYKRMGFKVTGTHEKHYFGKKAVIFTKYF